jgi:hypothetical protein
MRTLGFGLLVAGFLAGAYFASLDPVVTDWWRFVPSVAVAIAGVAILRVQQRLAATSSEKLSGDREILFTSLDNIVSNLDGLQRDRAALPAYELRFEVDRLFRDDLFRFADARGALVHLFGLQQYADIMSEFAAGERYLNRVWSASADGYADEASAYIDKAADQFRAARDLLASIGQPAGVTQPG